MTKVDGLTGREGGRWLITTDGGNPVTVDLDTRELFYTSGGPPLRLRTVEQCQVGVSARFSIFNGSERDSWHWLETLKAVSAVAAHS